MNRGHTRTDAECFHPALQGSNTLFKHRVGGIPDPGVDIPFDFEVEQSRAVRRAIKLERNRLIDRHCHGLGRGIAVVAYVNRDGLSFHAFCGLTRNGKPDR